MIFESKNKVYDDKNVRYIAEWSVDTDTQTVTHTDKNTLEVKEWSFHEDFIRYHLHYREEYSPELLQKVIDNGDILQYLEDLVEMVTDKINNQTEIWCEQDKDFQIANESGNLLEVGKITNGYREQAKKAIYDAYVYV